MPSMCHVGVLPKSARRLTLIFVIVSECAGPLLEVIGCCSVHHATVLMRRRLVPLVFREVARFLLSAYVVSELDVFAWCDRLPGVLAMVPDPSADAAFSCLTLVGAANSSGYSPAHDACQAQSPGRTGIKPPLQRRLCAYVMISGSILSCAGVLVAVEVTSSDAKGHIPQISASKA